MHFCVFVYRKMYVLISGLYYETESILLPFALGKSFLRDRLDKQHPSNKSNTLTKQVPYMWYHRSLSSTDYRYLFYHLDDFPKIPAYRYGILDQRSDTTGTVPCRRNLNRKNHYVRRSLSRHICTKKLNYRETSLLWKRIDEKSVAIIRLKIST